jgi:polyisoprenoid-binding protein YceI
MVLYLYGVVPLLLQQATTRNGRNAMTTTTTAATGELSGTYAADGVHSVFGFSVLHNGISLYKGTLDDVSAELRAGDDGIALEGAGKVESISIVQPEQLRAHVLGPDFFDAESHPEVSFRSTEVVVS